MQVCTIGYPFNKYTYYFTSMLANDSKIKKPGGRG
jgi:hypothetical protein